MTKTAAPVLVAATLGFAALGLAAPATAKQLCTVLADAGSGAVLYQDGACDRRVPPASTFKIAISLMGADAGILIDEHRPLWPFQAGYADWLPSWRQDTDPAAWMKNSVVWYSQQITQRLGMDRFTSYVTAFDYGNQDLVGNPGKDDGLTRAWLSSSLEITPLEQIGFLKKMLRHELPVSAHAYALTASLTRMDGGPVGWELHGKTGTGAPAKADGGRDWDHAYGWFVGWVESDNRTIVFARLNQDDGPQPISAGYRARDEILSKLPGLLAGY